MDFKSLLQSFDTITEGDVVHKGSYGNKYGKEDVRDQYGHKIGKVDKGEEAKKSEPKKGRGRPKKDVGDAGTSFDSSALSNVLGGKKPSKNVGTVSKKHSLKEYMEAAEQSLSEAEQIDEGVMDWAKEKYHDYQTGRQWSKHAKAQRKGDAAGMQAAQDAANMHKDKLQVARLNRTGTTLSKNSTYGMDQDRANIAALQKKGLVPQDYGRVEEAEQVTIAPAQQSTQVIKQGDKTLGTVNNPQLAAQIKQSIGKGEMSFNTDEEMQEEVDTGEADARKTVTSGEKGDWDKNFREKLKQFTKELAQHQAQKQGQVAEGKKPDFLDVDKDSDEKESFKKAVKDKEKKKVDESISLSESPETLQHIITRYKNEVKRFINGEELDSDLYEALFDYYSDCGEIPYGVAKGRTGDPFEWITQRFDQDVHDHVVDENTIRDFTQHALKEPTNNFKTIGQEPGAMAAPRGSKTVINRPVPEPTPWSVDPINAATDRAFNFIDSLKKKTPFSEGTDMKDIQLESWENQLNGLLNEGLTVSSSTGQQGQPNSVTVSATDNDADSLMQVLRSAGIGGFGAEPEAPEIGYGVAQGGEEEFDGTGTEPQPSPDVVGDGDDMLSLIKKLSGMSGGDAEVVAVSGDEEGSDDYKDEEGSDDTALQPADGGEEQGSDEESEEGDDEEQTDEGNMFTGNLAKARAQGKEEADLDGDGDMEKVKEGEDTCNECGMYESECGCDHVEESFANSAKDPAEQEMMKLKALLSMGNDLNRAKSSQTVGNPVRAELSDWKKLSGI